MPRRSCGGVLALGRQASTGGSRTAHCVSLSIVPPESGGTKRMLRQVVETTTGPNPLNQRIQSPPIRP